MSVGVNSGRACYVNEVLAYGMCVLRRFVEDRSRFTVSMDLL